MEDIDEKISPLEMLFCQGEFLSRTPEYVFLKKEGYFSEKKEEFKKKLEGIKSKSRILYDGLVEVIKADKRIKKRINEIQQSGGMSAKLEGVFPNYSIDQDSTVIHLDISINLFFPMETIQHDFNLALPGILDAINTHRESLKNSTGGFWDLNKRNNGEPSRLFKTKKEYWDKCLQIYDLFEEGKKADEIIRIAFSYDEIDDIDGNGYDNKIKAANNHRAEAKKMIEFARSGKLRRKKQSISI